MCVGDCIKKHIWKGIAIILLISTITFAVLYATKVYKVKIKSSKNISKWIFPGNTGNGNGYSREFFIPRSSLLKMIFNVQNCSLLYINLAGAGLTL